ncbi:WD40-repeat-containing domain protein [Chytridium lagenaria]|nr:WD40-repeat-containing domain protein [Chytridium lagenaria]
MGVHQECSPSLGTSGRVRLGSGSHALPIHEYLRAREVLPRGISRHVRSASRTTPTASTVVHSYIDKRWTLGDDMDLSDDVSSDGMFRSVTQLPSAAEEGDVSKMACLRGGSTGRGIFAAALPSPTARWMDSKKFDQGALSGVMDVASRRLPAKLQERQFDVSGLDKIFASLWLNDSEIVLGTKCNRLIVMNVNTSKRFEIPSIVGHRSSTGWSYGSVPAAAVSPFSMCATSPLSPPTVVPRPSTETSGVPQAAPQSRRDSEHFQCCGIHSLAINPSKTMLAVGSGHPTEFIQIYKLPTFEPLAILSGHSDMVFSVAWLSDNVLVSGSRDTTLKMWSLTDEYLQTTVQGVNNATVSIYQPVLTKKEHCGKVRDLKFNDFTKQTTTLATDGTVKIFDASRLSLAVSVPLVYTNETVCLGMGVSENIYSVGSQSHISLIDPRVGSIVHMIESCDEGWGVRSMNVDNGVITIGGGYGRISFYDLRSQSYLAWRPRNKQDEEQPDVEERYLQNGGGWLDRDQFYMNHFRGQSIRNAVYTLSYDPCGVRFFAAGGPLQLNLCGSYAGLWE